MQLVISVTGPNNPKILAAFSQVLVDSHCSLLESRSTVLANKFSGFWLVEGNWNHVAKLENNLEHLAKRLELQITTTHIEEQEPIPEQLPYIIDIIGTDTTVMLKKLTAFLTERNINITELNTSRYPGAHTGTLLFSAHLIVGIPAHSRPISLRDEFLDFCDRNGFDAILEPIKQH